jgi:hypothetical protein
MGKNFLEPLNTAHYLCAAISRDIATGLIKRRNGTQIPIRPKRIV